jgi:flagellin
MAVVINTNVDALKIQSLLNTSTSKMSTTMQKMSSGLKILSAKDDAAGTVISAKMQVQLNGNQIAQKNVQNANALLSTAEGNLDVVEDNLSRIRDLTLQAKNGTYSEEEIKAMQDEVEERINEINRVNNSCKLSQLRLFGDNDGAGNAQGLADTGAKFQVGSNDGVDNTIEANKALFQSVEFSAMTGASNYNLIEIARGNKDDKVEYNKPQSDTLDNLEAATFDEAKGEDAFDQAIRALDNAIDNITSRKSIIGSAGNRMDSALSTLTTQYENLSSANSIITDSDIAEQASKYTQESILQQISTSLLAQANQAPSVALSLV